MVINCQCTLVTQQFRLCKLGNAIRKRGSSIRKDSFPMAHTCSCCCCASSHTGLHHLASSTATWCTGSVCSAFRTCIESLFPDAERLAFCSVRAVFGSARGERPG